MPRPTLLPIAIAVLLFCLDIQAAVTVISAETKGSSLPPPNTVSWQTAFWILVALALNAMTQNSTLDRHFPAGVLFPMRSSPIICAADTLEALLKLLAYMYAGASTAGAARRVVRERMWQPPRNCEVATDPDPLPFGQQHPRIHIVVFVLGVLPQAIKLFGMHGIPWIQACGVMYLSSFLVIASLGVLAQCAGGSTPRTRAGMVLGRRSREVLWLGVVIAQVELWGWCALRLAWNTSKGSVVHNILQTMAYSSSPTVIFIAVSVPFILSKNCDHRIAFVCPIFATAVFLLCVFGMEDLAAGYLWVFVPISGCLLTAVVSIIWVMASRDRCLLPAFRNFLIISFGVANLVFSILYYRFLYDPTGTVKPSWVEVLG